MTPRMENHTYLDELKETIDEWAKNIKVLKIKANSVAPHKKVAYQRELDLLVVKLSNLREYWRQSTTGDDTNTRTRTIIQNTLREMERTFANAISKMR